ncbi:MAG: branched-chain amino acid ABC transporter permease [Symbiobacteriia bacterium]
MLAAVWVLIEGVQLAIPAYPKGILVFAGINVIITLGLNLITGVTGQLSLGHAAFMGIGAYAAAISTVALHLPFGVALLVGGLLSAAFGVLLGFPTLRLTGDYLAIATLGFAEIVRVVNTNLTITNGAVGYYGIKKLVDLPLVVALAVAAVFFVSWLENSRNGRAMRAVREDEIAATACGVNTTFYKIQAFAVGAFLAGVGGGLYAHTTTFIQPPDFGFLKSVELLSMVVLGGMGSIPGTILGAVVLSAAPELLRSLSDYRMLVYGGLLIVLMIFRPGGLLGGVDLRVAVRRALLLGKRRPGATVGGEGQ